MSIIKVRTVSLSGDHRIQLNNSSCARVWSSDLGTNWTSLRLACRYSVTDSGGDITATPRFAFGIQSGTNLFLSSGGPANWCGFATDVNWSRVAGPPVYYQLPNGNNCIAAKKVGTSFTAGGSFSGGSSTCFDIYYSIAAEIRGMMAVEITKGSPNYTFRFFRRGLASGGDVAVTTFLQQIVLPLGSMSVAGHVYQGTAFSPGSVALAVNESAGVFNAVGISWDHSDALIELSDVTVARLA